MDSSLNTQAMETLEDACWELGSARVCSASCKSLLKSGKVQWSKSDKTAISKEAKKLSVNLTEGEWAKLLNEYSEAILSGLAVTTSLPLTYKNVQVTTGVAGLGLIARPDAFEDYEKEALEDLLSELSTKYPGATISETCVLETNKRFGLAKKFNPERADLVEIEDDSREACIGVVITVDGVQYAVNLSDKQNATR